MQMERRFLNVHEAEELHYGKVVTSRMGHIEKNANYKITAYSFGLGDPGTLIPRKIFAGVAVDTDDIEPAMRDRGALVFRGIAGGLVAMRLRFRPEDGEDGSARAFMIANTLFLPDALEWTDVPVGFFTWCERNLIVEPTVVGEPTQLQARRMNLPKIGEFGDLMDRPDLDHLAAHIFLDDIPGLAIGPNGAHRQDSGTIAEFAEDLDRLVDVINKLIGQGDLPKRSMQDFAIAIGIRPDILPGWVRYTMTGRLDIAQLRKQRGTAGSRLMNSPKQTTEKSAAPVPSRPLVSYLSDSLQRPIGLEGFDVQVRF